MGAVFRAQDTRLGRDVALKLLPARSFDDETSRLGLIREARLAASLNHPNICTVYEVGEAAGEVYIAMELVRGRELRATIPPGGLPIEVAARHGARIAEALAHAHAHGVLHRDLKSSNVIVSDDGRIKLLDFGLARRFSDDIAADSAQRTLTGAGAVVGTPHFMAPEVLRGEPADPRSDLWALGVVVHEMLSGALPFAGRTGHALSAAILNDLPAPLPPRVPAGLRAVVLRCLAKEPSQRYQTASEARAALEAVLAGESAAIAAPVHTPRIGRVVLIGLAFVAALVALTWLERHQPWRRRELMQRQLTSNPAGDPVFAGVLSPDGKTLAVEERGGLTLRSVETGESHSVELPPGFEFIVPFKHVAWFPDGGRLLVGGRMADGRLSSWAIPIAGGRTREILGDGQWAAVSPDGSRLAFLRAGARGSELWISGSNGEDARRVVGDDSTGLLSWATWAPGGRRLVYSRVPAGAQGDERRLESCDLEGRSRVMYTPPPDRLLHGYTVPLWLPDGRVMFGLSDPPPNQRDMNLYWLRADPRSGKPAGVPRRVTQWQRLAFVWPTAISSDGRRMSVAALQYQSDCYVGRVAGRDSLLQDIHRLTLDDRMDILPSWTPDGRAIVFSSDRNGSFDIFRQRLDANDAEPLVTGAGDQVSPRVSPDQAWVLYRDEDAGTAPRATIHGRIMRIPIAGGTREKVLDTGGGGGFRCPSVRGRPCVVCEQRRNEAVFTAFDPDGGRGAVIARVPAPLPPTWDLSPDGTTIATVPPGPDRDSVRSIRLLSTTGAASREIRLDRPTLIAHLAWGADGRSWYVVEPGAEWALKRVDERGRSRAVVPPQMWMYSSAVSPDGRHVVFTSNTGDGNIWMLEDF